MERMAKCVVVEKILALRMATLRYLWVYRRSSYPIVNNAEAEVIRSAGID
jgi:hypothetical protein